MGQTNDNPSPGRPPEPGRSPRPGRLRSALSVLRGEDLVPAQIRWEWAEYQHQFNDLLQRYSATLARAAKAEKKRLQGLHAALELEQQPQHRELPQPGDHKAELRSRAAQLRGLHLSPSSSPQPAPEPPPEEVP